MEGGGGFIPLCNDELLELVSPLLVIRVLVYFQGPTVQQEVLENNRNVAAETFNSGIFLGSSKKLLSKMVILLRFPPPSPRKAIRFDQVDEGEGKRLKIISVGVSC